VLVTASNGVAVERLVLVYLQVVFFGSYNLIIVSQRLRASIYNIY